jgi:hypothetical protein
MRALIVVAGLLFAAQAAQATPFISISSVWSVNVDPFYNPTIPAGFEVSCYGSAYSGGGQSCYATASIGQPVTASAHLATTVLSGVVFTNNTNGYLSGFIDVFTGFSAFNPGGPDVGISIDDATTQGARFSSGVRGPGVGDFHDCSIGIYGESGTVFTPTSCGVSSPDSSQSDFTFDLSTIAPMSSIMLPYELSIVSDFFIPVQPPGGVPEPAAVLVMLSGLLAMRFVSRRKAIA